MERYLHNTWIYKPKPIPADCPQFPDAGVDGSANDGGDGGDGVDGGMARCASCVDPPPAGWTGPITLVRNSFGQAAECPPDAPNILFEGRPEPSPLACATCTCDEPEGTCTLPTTWTISSRDCSDPTNGIKTTMNPPAGWDGTCTGANAIAPGKMCGSELCVRSVSVSKPVIEEKPCTAHETVPDMPIPRARAIDTDTPWMRICAGALPSSACAKQPEKVCSPTSASQSSCVWRTGEHACPTGFAERIVIYDKMEDTRACGACTCDAPSGGFCEVKWRIYKGPNCTMDYSAFVSTNMTPACHDFLAGDALTGQSAEITEYTKGTCAPHREIKGDVQLVEPATICCAAPTE